MLDPARVAEVKRLLAEGLSNRKVAARTGVSRQTVNRIASGKRPDYGPKKPQPGAIVFSGPARRCPKCGALVYPPCYACRVRSRLASSPRPYRDSPGEAVPLGLALNLEHRARYELIRHRKIEEECNNVHRVT